MEEADSFPILVSSKPLGAEFESLEEIHLTSNETKFGRCLGNDVVISFLPISRMHCVIKKVNNAWVLEDRSSFGMKVNGEMLSKGNNKILSDGDIIHFDSVDNFVYKFEIPKNDDFEIPKKRMRMNTYIDSNIINNMKMKFEASQTNEIKHIEAKIESAKKMQTNSMFLKEKLKLDMDRKMEQLQADFAEQIENLKGEKVEVEQQKALLIEERDLQLKNIKEEMEGKISELMDQIRKHNETESELLKENNLLKEKLQREREEFLSELSRENSSKQDMLDKLEAKMKEQDESRQREKQELQEQMKRENEMLRLAKEKELKELEEKNRQREIELKEGVEKLKKHLEEQMQMKQQLEQQLHEQTQEMKKLSDEEKCKMEQVLKERQEIQRQLKEAQVNAEKSSEELKKRVADRETELAALAAERIQQQAEQSGEVISTLQEQLEKAKSELQSCEMEKNTLLESICSDMGADIGECSKQSTLTHVGELMESELQCSICAELFVEATNLSCSHTFCKYCITMWRKKKNDCPICRAPIRSECRSLVLDTFIEKMVQNLTEEMKAKRQTMLEQRAELVAAQACSTAAGSRCRSERNESSDLEEEGSDEPTESDGEDVDDEQGVDGDQGIDSDQGVDDEQDEDEHDEDAEDDYFDHDDEQFDYDDHYLEYSDDFVWETFGWRAGYRRYDSSSGSSSGSDDADASTVPAAGAGAAGTAPATVEGDTTTGANSNNNRRRRRGIVPGVPGSYYGGYGRCFSCGARGHWAPGCPYR